MLPRVVFMGSPDFALATLRSLASHYPVVGVVTQPDRPAGRGQNLTPPPIKKLALELEIPTIQPRRLREPEAMDQLRSWSPELIVVAAFGQILRQEVLDLPLYGCINVHASLLPRWRGAAPIHAAILAGDSHTGVTIMRMVPALDAGPMVLQAATPIAEDETAGELSLRLSELGALALIEAMTLISLGRAHEEPQDDARATYVGKIDRDSARIDWAQPAVIVCRSIRAYDPKPGAHTLHRGEPLKLFGARVLPHTNYAPGKIVEIEEHGMIVACGDGAVRITQVQPAGRGRMTPVELERGRGLKAGEKLGTSDELTR
jgi:methionyl-tRNA formyltransferase